MKITDITPNGDNFIAAAQLTEEEGKQLRALRQKNVKQVSMGYTVEPAPVNYYKL